MTTRAKTRRVPAFGMALAIVALSLFVVFVAATSNAAADNGPSDWSSFGIDASTKQASSKAASNPSGSFANAGEATLTEASVLEASSSTDISAGIATIEEEERIAEEARKAAERATIEAASAAQANYDAVVSTNLPDVDWTVGEEKFVAEWGSRIDAYLAGSPLSGYGKTFAQAAWNNQIDPRWSPAISNTESSKGSVCFRSHNAWGWGNSGWSNWEEAINAHVAGLAAGYGYSITLGAAQKYCPPNYQNWYNNTVGQMALI